MSREPLSAQQRLTRIRGLVADVPGPLGNGEAFAWADLAGADRTARVVHEHLSGADLAGERWPHDGARDPADLVGRLWEVSREGAVEVLAALLSGSLAYADRGRYGREKADRVARALAELVGPGAQWWTNTTLRSWNPLTWHTFDGAVIGSGGGVVVTILVWDED